MSTHTAARFTILVVLGWLLALTSPVTLSARQAVPNFAIVSSTGTYFYSTASVNDAVITATVTDNGGGQWTLNIIQAKQAIQAVYFPWQPTRTPLDGDLSNDIYYYPYLLGRTEKAPNHDADWTWWGLPYPGSAEAPLVVMADPLSARIVAATNWPPKLVTPLYAAQRLVLQYDVSIPIGGSTTFGALIATVTGNAVTGDVPWQKALDLYRTWLDANRGPVVYPTWMTAGQGMINTQLEGYSTVAGFDSFVQANKTRYPWLVMWGQNSPLGGSCCGIDPVTVKYYTTLPQINSRWVPSLVDWAKIQTSAGYHVAYYSAPYDGQYGDGTDRMLDTATGISWFNNWNAANQAGGANSFYFDVLARRPWGDPDAILDLFNAGTISSSALSEGLVDIYPIPGLASGSLAGGATCGAPLRTPESATITTFPPFVRYLLGDRLIFWGAENDDAQFFGTQSRTGCDYATYCTNGVCDYGLERVTFLTGARISISPGMNNAIFDAMVSERERVNWWPRQPRYLATKGLNLSTIAPSTRIEVSHFIDNAGASLLAVSNPNQVTGQSFTLNSVSVAVPTAKIAIVDLGTPPPPPPDDLEKLTAAVVALQAQDVIHSTAIAALQSADVSLAAAIAALTVRVTALENSSPPSPTFTLTVTPLSQPRGTGASVTVTWANIPNPTPDDWLGVYPASAPNQPATFTNNDERWKYVNCLRGNSGTVAVPSGSCSFNVSAQAAGLYNVRLFTNDTFAEIGRTANFTLTP